VTIMRHIAWVAVLYCLSQSSVMANPLGKSFQPIQQFANAYALADTNKAVDAFSPRASMFGITGDRLLTNKKDIREHFRVVFRAIKAESHRALTFIHIRKVNIASSAVLFVGIGVFSQSKAGRARNLYARFSFLVFKGKHGWKILHYHSSKQPS